jgi:competence protein ComEC
MWTYVYALRSFHAFFIAATLFICGICAAYSMHSAIFCLAIATACIAITARMTSSAYKTALLCLSLFALGFVRCYWQQASYKAMLQSLQQTTALHLYAQVTDIKKADHPRYKAVMVCSVTARYTDDSMADYAHSWNLQCYCATMPSCTVGDTIQLHNVHITPARNNDFGTFLLKENLHATAFIKRAQCSLVYHPAWSCARYLHELRQQITQQLHSKCSPQTFGLIMLIFFGDRLQAKKEYLATKELFNGWGIMHFLARSGLHLVIFIVALNYCLRRIPLAFGYKKLLLACICMLYYLLSWSSISFVRALLTFFWYTTYTLCNLQIDGPRIVMLVTTLCLVHNPMLLFFLDFQLSFGLTLVLAVITRSTTNTKLA